LFDVLLERWRTLVHPDRQYKKTIGSTERL
jgi:hypothetical protein